MNHRMISADDHIDSGICRETYGQRACPKACWNARRTSKIAARRASTGCATARPGRTIAASAGSPATNRTRLALDRGGVGEAHRPTTPDKRLTDMDRDGVEASLMFPPIIAMQVGEPN